MQIETIKVGYLDTNCYVITKNNQTIIIDPGDEFEKIKTFCQDKNVVGIFVTHHHFDHIGALKKLENLYHLTHNESTVWNMEVISCKGHAEDLIGFYFPEEKILFSGDFIFYHTIGRCDLEGSDFKEMQKSIQNILNYPKDIKIYPGHGIPTTLKEEIPYLEKYL
ncbi:MAG: MBL fold metallo-hydrolase [Bacilli bacterium]|nr:MBL fold metallo-hydrolase [Bacilli bacterium]